MRHGSRCDERGFTLLEALVAMAILGAASVASIGAVRANNAALERASHGLVASALAADRLTVLRTLPPRDREPLADSLREGRFVGAMTRYEWAVNVRTASVDASLLEARVTVRWAGGSESIVTLIPRDGR